MRFSANMIRRPSASPSTMSPARKVTLHFRVTLKLKKQCKKLLKVSDKKSEKTRTKEVRCKHQDLRLRRRHDQQVGALEQAELVCR